MTARGVGRRPHTHDGQWTTQSRKGARRGVKLHRPYTVEDVARLRNVSKRTVRRWIRAGGLSAVTDRKPTLILGEDLLGFLTARRHRSRHCRPEECYCVKCRAPRRPAGDMAEFIPLTTKTGNLRAICPECGLLMHKRIRCDAIEALGAILDVPITGAIPRL
jgi:excisionase family DNA binding protein